MPGSLRGWSRRAALVSLSYAATLILFVTATKTTTAASAIFLQAAAPLYVMLLSPWLLRERARVVDVAAMAVVAAGLACVLIDAPAPTTAAPNPPLGNILGAASGMTWALTVIGLRWLSAREGDAGTMSTVIGGNALTFVVCLPFALPLASYGAVDWAVILYLGAVQIGLAYVLFVRGIRGVPALEASMLLLVEPALNPLWAWLFHGEKPGPLAFGGGALILAATAARTLRTPQSPPEDLSAAAEPARR